MKTFDHHLNLHLYKTCVCYKRFLWESLGVVLHWHTNIAESRYCFIFCMPYNLFWSERSLIPLLINLKFEKIQIKANYLCPEAIGAKAFIIPGWIFKIFQVKIFCRDLKLDNTLLTDSSPPRLKLCDFGFAKGWLKDTDQNMFTHIG